MKFGEHLRNRGYEVTYLPVDESGMLDLGLLANTIRPDTALVSVMWANNETGVVFPIEEIAAICHSRGALFHTDAVQVAGKLPIDVRETHVDYLSLSAHKLHAPKGIGCLFVRRGAPFTPYVVGGGQERGCRGGTENVPYIVGFGRAAEIAMGSIEEENTRVRAMRDRLEDTILSNIPRVSRNGAKAQRLPNTSNLAFHGVESEALLLMLDQAGICAATGSACKTGSIEPSHVLTAMGFPADLAKGSLASASASTTPMKTSTTCSTISSPSFTASAPKRNQRRPRPDASGVDLNCSNAMIFWIRRWLPAAPAWASISRQTPSPSLNLPPPLWPVSRSARGLIVRTWSDRS